MKKKELEHYASSINKMADASGEVIRTRRLNSFETEIKGDGSPVTSVDQAAERKIREIISDLHPEHGITGEEYDDKDADNELVWVIDPIDGTLPFLAGIPVFGTLIALMQNGKPVLGAIDMPMTHERWIGGGADLPTTHNGKLVRTRDCEDLSHALMSTSNPDYYDEETKPALHRMRNSTRLNVYGGSCMAYAQIASGRIDVGIDVLFDIYDFLALVPVIKGAGGTITDWNGDELNQSSGDKFVASGDARTHEQALKVINNK
ncbi:MAG: inositol monophosphatase family protein [Rhodospirillales bacterium]|nr:inositol monophosphatase family protein [Rhodospirillales bacterium]